jgi:diguanylate cyclase (GGDEF)-like protein
MQSTVHEPRVTLVIRYVSWVGIGAHAAFVPLFLALELPHLALFNVLSVVLWVTAKIVNQRGRCTPAMWLIFAEVMGHAVLAVMTLGWASGFQNYLIPLIPFVMFNDRLRAPVAVIASFIALLTFASLSAFAPASSALAQESPIRYVNMVIPFLALALVSYYFRLASTDAERRLERVAATDPLTGLLNRRSMSARLMEEEARHLRTGAPFALILADVDHFKRINDAHGHAVGDRVLTSVAGVLHGSLRTQDAAARWGGEEFLLLLPDTDLEGAEEVASRLRRDVQERLPELRGMPVDLTLTFGVAAYTPAPSVDACLKAADDALYRGKAEGRDRVVSARPSES